MTTPVKPEQDPGHILTGAEWAAAQYAPQRFDQDPKAQMPMGRVLTGAEWDQMQRSSNPSKLTFPALPTPKFVADQTKRLNPNAGKPDQSILDQLNVRQAAIAASPVIVGGLLKADEAISPYTEAAGAGVRKAATAFDAAQMALGGTPGAAAGVTAAALRQGVAPIVEHPLSTVAVGAAVAASPVVVGGLVTADMLMNLGKYGYQYVHEQMMTPEERAKAQQDPNRISGEAAVAQAIIVSLGGLGFLHGITKAADVSQGVVEAGAASLRPLVQSPVGATELGAAAAVHGLPATASPYPPESPLSAAWRDGYDKPRIKIPGTVEQAPEPVNEAGYTQTHLNEYRKAQEDVGLRLITPDQALQMTPEELRAYATQSTAAEKTLAQQALDPETLKRFNAAERKANSQFASNAETDAASKVMRDIEDQMTPHQRLLMYGSTDVNYTTAEEARAMADAAERVAPETFIADEQAGNPIPNRDLLSDVGRLITTGNANLGHNVQDPAALIQLKGTVAELQRRGMTTDQILKAALEERVRRGYATPEQALSIGKSTLEKLQTGGFFGGQPTEPVAPRITEGQRALPAPPEVAAPPVAEPTVPPAAPTEPIAGPEYKGPVSLYGRLSNDALGAEYRTLLEKRTELEPAAQAPLWTPEREAEAVANIENRRRPDGSLAPADKRALANLQAAQGEEYYVGRHTFESAAAEQRLNAINKHIAGIEQQFANRGLDAAKMMQEPATGGGLAPIEGTGETRTRGLATSTVSRVAEDIKSLWSDLPEYNRMNISEQAHRATDIVAKDPARAKSIAMGDEPAPIQDCMPKRSLSHSETRLRAEGDVGLIHDLATGGLTEQATTMGQKLRLLAENDPEDPVAKIRRISDKRSEGRGAAKAIKSETDVMAKHTELNLKSLMDFFESQKC